MKIILLSIIALFFVGNQDQPRSADTTKSVVKKVVKDSEAKPADSVKETSKDEAAVSFKKDVYPIFRKKCLSCHNADDGNPSELYLDDYASLMKGDSKHGPVITKGKGEASIIIMKLRGMADFGKQMPRGKKPLDDEMIKTIATWIDQGAKDN